MDNENLKEAEKPAKSEKPANKKKRFGLIVFIVGLATLVAGAVFLLINILKGPDIRDAEYLVQIGTWQLEDEPAVVWEFTEIGKGTLTTNSHLNDYDFIWAMDGNRIKIETDWLYTLNNEYVYELDQNDNELVLMGDDDTFIFVPAPKNTDETTEEETN